MVIDYRILYRNEEAFPGYNVLTKRFIKIYVSKYKKGLFGQKKTNNSYVENNIFQKIGEYPLNTARMLNILPAKNKSNIVSYKLNVYKTSAKQP